MCHVLPSLSARTRVRRLNRPVQVAGRRALRHVCLYVHITHTHTFARAVRHSHASHVRARNRYFHACAPVKGSVSYAHTHT